MGSWKLSTLNKKIFTSTIKIDVLRVGNAAFKSCIFFDILAFTFDVSMSYSVDDVVSNAFKKRMILDSFFAFNCSGTMKVSTWVYDKGEWYYVSSSGAMIANDWVKDNGK